jgi:lipoprotein-releasing system ATP-binding protein
MNRGVDSAPIVSLRGLTRSFEQGGQRIDVLRGVDLDIMPGEIVALLGPSGSGKSTMLQAVGLLEGGFSGSIEIAGQQAEKLPTDGRTKLRREHLGFVYQFHHLRPDFDARENVIMPQMIAGASRAEAEERADSLLGSLGLEHRLTHRPSQLSGGEQQRVAVARAMAHEPDVLLADEPTGSLDSRNSNALMDLLRTVNQRDGQTIVLITHSPAVAERADRVVYMHDGRLVDQPAE